MHNQNTAKNLRILIFIVTLMIFVGCNLTTKSAAKNEKVKENVMVQTVATPKTAAKVNDAKLFGVNLIQNGGAESGSSSPWTNADDNLKTFRYDGGWGDAW